MKIVFQAKLEESKKVFTALYRLANIQCEQGAVGRVFEACKHSDSQMRYNILSDFTKMAYQQKKEIVFYTANQFLQCNIKVVHKGKEVIKQQHVFFQYRDGEVYIESPETPFLDEIICRMLFVLGQNFYLLKNLDITIEKLNESPNTLKLGMWLTAYMYAVMNDEAAFNSTIDSFLGA